MSNDTKDEKMTNITEEDIPQAPPATPKLSHAELPTRPVAKTEEHFLDQPPKVKEEKASPPWRIYSSPGRGREGTPASGPPQTPSSGLRNARESTPAPGFRSALETALTLAQRADKSGITTYGPVPPAKQILVKDETGRHAGARKKYEASDGSYMFEGSDRGKLLEKERLYFSLLQDATQEDSIDIRKEIQEVEDDKYKSIRKWAKVSETAPTNPSAWMNETWGPEIRNPENIEPRNPNAEHRHPSFTGKLSPQYNSGSPGGKRIERGPSSAAPESPSKKPKMEAGPNAPDTTDEDADHEMIDDDELQPLDPRHHEILSCTHRNSRVLVYRIVGKNFDQRFVGESRLLAGPLWTSKMATYWASPHGALVKELLDRTLEDDKCPSQMGRYVMACRIGYGWRTLEFTIWDFGVDYYYWAKQKDDDDDSDEDEGYDRGMIEEVISQRC